MEKQSFLKSKTAKGLGFGVLVLGIGAVVLSLFKKNNNEDESPENCEIIDDDYDNNEITVEE